MKRLIILVALVIMALAASSRDVRAQCFPSGGAPFTLCGQVELNMEGDLLRAHHVTCKVCTTTTCSASTSSSQIIATGEAVKQYEPSQGATGVHSFEVAMQSSADDPSIGKSYFCQLTFDGVVGTRGADGRIAMMPVQGATPGPGSPHPFAKSKAGAPFVVEVTGLIK